MSAFQAIEASAPDPALNRAAINQANAQHSTGPRTEAGKQRSSLNALRHGLTSRIVVLPSEDPAAYQLHLQRFVDELQPQGALEEHLVQSLAATAWRLNRIPALETSLLAAALPGNETDADADHPEALHLALADALTRQIRALSMLSMNEQRLSRHFDRTLRQLRELQAERRASESDQPAEDETTAPSEQAGFVLQKNPIDAYLARRAFQERELAFRPARPLARSVGSASHSSA